MKRLNRFPQNSFVDCGSLTRVTTLRQLWGLLLLLLVVLPPKAVVVQAKDQIIAWVEPAGGAVAMPVRTAYVGDTFTFLFETGAHNVYIHPSEDCDPTGSYLVGKAGNGATKYTFQERDVGRRIFACQIGNHCYMGGQILTVVVYPPPSPADQQYDKVPTEEEEDQDAKNSDSSSSSSSNRLSGGAGSSFTALLLTTTTLPVLTWIVVTAVIL
ncbi:hypothetical protein ACA910_006500 [Epithemia clementina (nom. ined.)]